MIEPQQFPNLEAAEARIARVDRAIAFWRSQGYAYVTLSPAGTANPHMPGRLRALLLAVAAHPGAQLVELADPTSRAQILRWALTSRPTATKGTN